MLSKKNIIFNPLKHHAGYVRDFLVSVDSSLLSTELKKVGNCQLDFYYGELGIDSIYHETLTHLYSLEIHTDEDYRACLQPHKGFYTLVLSDQSKWILRRGVDEQRFVHIHPARYSPFTVRVVANTLKTLIAWGYFRKKGKVDLNIKKLNDIRCSILELSPVKRLEDMKAVQRLINLVFTAPYPEEENRIAYI